MAKRMQHVYCTKDSEIGFKNLVLSVCMCIQHLYIKMLVHNVIIDIKIKSYLITF